MEDQKKKNRYLENCGFIDPQVLPLNPDGYRACRYCKKSVKPPKRTFCSADCVHEYRIRSDGSYLRECVFARDQGVCAICLIDTKETAELLTSTKGEIRDQILKSHNIHKTRKINPEKNGGGLWDADHITPVKDGGGECGMENIRTLCISCHKIITFSKK
jgi:5-methylcytosine-specific restriction enzyme A